MAGRRRSTSAALESERPAPRGPPSTDGMDAGGRGPALAAGCAAAFAVSLRGAEGPAGSSRRLRVLRGPSCPPHVSTRGRHSRRRRRHRHPHPRRPEHRGGPGTRVSSDGGPRPGSRAGGLPRGPGPHAERTAGPRQQEAGTPGRPTVCKVPPRGRADTSFLNNAGDEGESVKLLP